MATFFVGAVLQKVARKLFIIAKNKARFFTTNKIEFDNFEYPWEKI